jgi:hypothetical protein
MLGYFSPGQQGYSFSFLSYWFPVISYCNVLIYISSKRLVLIYRRLGIWDFEFMKPCGEYLTMPSLNFAYLVFIKQMVKVKRSILCIRFGETKIGLNVNLFHVIGPTSGSVSTVLFTPWPIGIVNIALSLKLTQCTYFSSIVKGFVKHYTQFWQN